MQEEKLTLEEHLQIQIRLSQKYPIIHLSRIKHLAQILLAQLRGPGENKPTFDMSNWGHINEGRLAATCGTSCCAAGLAIFDERFQLQGFCNDLHRSYEKATECHSVDFYPVFLPSPEERIYLRMAYAFNSPAGMYVSSVYWLARNMEEADGWEALEAFFGLVGIPMQLAPDHRISAVRYIFESSCYPDPHPDRLTEDKVIERILEVGDLMYLGIQHSHYAWLPESEEVRTMYQNLDWNNFRSKTRFELADMKKSAAV